MSEYSNDRTLTVPTNPIPSRRERVAVPEEIKNIKRATNPYADYIPPTEEEIQHAANSLKQTDFKNWQQYHAQMAALKQFGEKMTDTLDFLSTSEFHSDGPQFPTFVGDIVGATDLPSRLQMVSPDPDAYAQSLYDAQTAAQRLGNATVQFGALAGTTLAAGTVGILTDGLTALAKGQSMWAGPITQWAADLGDQVREEYQIFKPIDYEDRNFLYRISHGGFSEFVANMGFTLGAMGAGTVWAAIPVVGSVLAPLMGAIGEGNLEAAMHYNQTLQAGWDMIQKGYEEDLANGVSPEVAEARKLSGFALLEEDARKQSNRVAATTYAWGTLSNKLQFGKMWKNFRGVAPEMGENVARGVLNKNTLANRMRRAFGKPIKGDPNAFKEFTRFDKALASTGKAIKLGGLEGLEEGIQSFAPEITSRRLDLNSFYHHAYNTDYREMGHNFGEAFQQAWNHLLNGEGKAGFWDSVFMGALGGMMGMGSIGRKTSGKRAGKLGFVWGGGISEIADTWKAKTKANELIAEWNRNGVNATTGQSEDLQQRLTRSLLYSDLQDYAILENDEELFNAATAMSEFNDIITLHKLGRMDLLKKTANQLEEMDDTALEKISQALSRTDGSGFFSFHGISTSNIKQVAQQKAQNLKKNIRNYENSYVKIKTAAPTFSEATLAEAIYSDYMLNYYKDKTEELAKKRMPINLERISEIKDLETRRSNLTKTLKAKIKQHNNPIEALELVRKRDRLQGIISGKGKTSKASKEAQELIKIENALMKLGYSSDITAKELEEENKNLSSLKEEIKQTEQEIEEIGKGLSNLKIRRNQKEETKKQTDKDQTESKDKVLNFLKSLGTNPTVEEFQSKLREFAATEKNGELTPEQLGEISDALRDSPIQKESALTAYLNYRTAVSNMQQHGMKLAKMLASPEEANSEVEKNLEKVTKDFEQNVKSKLLKDSVEGWKERFDFLYKEEEGKKPVQSKSALKEFIDLVELNFRQMMKAGISFKAILQYLDSHINTSTAAGKAFKTAATAIAYHTKYVQKIESFLDRAAKAGKEYSSIHRTIQECLNLLISDREEVLMKTLNNPPYKKSAVDIWEDNNITTPLDLVKYEKDYKKDERGVTEQLARLWDAVKTEATFTPVKQAKSIKEGQASPTETVSTNNDQVDNGTISEKTPKEESNNGTQVPGTPIEEQTETPQQNPPGTPEGTSTIIPEDPSVVTPEEEASQNNNNPEEFNVENGLPQEVIDIMEAASETNDAEAVEINKKLVDNSTPEVQLTDPHLHIPGTDIQLSPLGEVISTDGDRKKVFTANKDLEDAHSNAIAQALKDANIYDNLSYPNLLEVTEGKDLFLYPLEYKVNGEDHVVYTLAFEDEGRTCPLAVLSLNTIKAWNDEFAINEGYLPHEKDLRKFYSKKVREARIRLDHVSHANYVVSEQGHTLSKENIDSFIKYFGEENVKWGFTSKKGTKYYSHNENLLETIDSNGELRNKPGFHQFLLVKTQAKNKKGENVWMPFYIREKPLEECETSVDKLVEIANKRTSTEQDIINGIIKDLYDNFHISKDMEIMGSTAGITFIYKKDTAEEAKVEFPLFKTTIILGENPSINKDIIKDFITELKENTDGKGIRIRWHKNMSTEQFLEHAILFTAASPNDDSFSGTWPKVYYRPHFTSNPNSSTSKNLQSDPKDNGQIPDNVHSNGLDIQFRSTEYTSDVENMKIWNQEEEIAVIQKIHPDLFQDDAIRIVESIKQVKQDGKAWGKYVNQVITIYKGAEVGTIYHEAFHGVMRHLFSKREKDTFLEEFAKKYDLDRQLYTDEMLEEKAAEEFRAFMLKIRPRTTFGKIRRYFAALLRRVKFIGDNVDYCTQIYRNINDGLYVERPIIDNTIAEGSKGNNKKGSLELVSEEIKERVNKKGLSAIYSYLSAQFKEAINNC